jgi:hypothetical protein
MGNAEALIVASKEVELEVNADRTKYKVMSPDQNAGRSHNVETDNRAFERVEEFRYLGTKVMSPDQNAGRSHKVETDNRAFEKVEEFRYLGTIIKNQILFRKILRADLSQGMLAIIRCRFFCHPKI